MNAKDVMKNSTKMSHMITRGYFQDLNDSELLIRPVPGMNHIAWQLGHLIVSSHGMLSGIGFPPASLPQGFKENYSKEMANSDDPAKFASTATYLEMADSLQAAHLAAIDAIDEKKLDEPGPEQMREYCPTVGDVLALAGSHWLMHAGQFVAVRRKLGKPPIF